MIKSARCRLIVSDEDRVALLDTLNSFAGACNDVLAYAMQTGRTHRFHLQADLYHPLKERYGLTANYVRQSCNRVAASFAAKHIPKIYRPTSAILDDHTLRYIEAAESVSISTIAGRRHIRISIGDYQRNLIRGWKFGPGHLSVDRKGNFYVCFGVTIPTSRPSGRHALGIDLGISRIATTSDGLILSGKSVNRKREHRARIKASIQSKGTKGSKRLLKRLAGRDARYMKDVNHCISRKLVDQAKTQDRFIALEDLTGIRERTAKHGRHHRRRMGRWAFYQLRQFIQYKAEEKGVLVVMVDPRNTSKTCPNCRELGSRVKHRFSCGSCGFTGDADIVGALNIAVAGDAVKHPKVA